MSDRSTPALNRAMGWILALWLLCAGFSDGYAPYICLVGAMLTVVLWVALIRWLAKDHPDE